MAVRSKPGIIGAGNSALFARIALNDIADEDIVADSSGAASY